MVELQYQLFMQLNFTLNFKIPMFHLEGDQVVWE